MTKHRIFCFLLFCSFPPVFLPSSHAAVTIKVADASGSPVFNALVTVADESDTTRIGKSLTDKNGLCMINPSGVGVRESAPQPFALGQNYPNPFNPETAIPFMLSHDGYVTLTIFNALGQHVRTLVKEWMPAGSHSAVWEGLDDQGFGVGAGIYIYVLRFGREQIAKKMLLLDGHGGRAAGGIPRAGMLLKPSAETYAVRIIGLDIDTYEKTGNLLTDGNTYEYIVTRKPHPEDIIFPGAGVSGTPVSDEWRIAAFAMITDKLNTIKSLYGVALHEQLARFLAEQPEFEISGYSAGGVWGRFTDGRLIVFDANVENIEAIPAPAQKPSNATIAPDAGKTAKPAAYSWTDIPQSKKIGLYRSHAEASGWLSNIKLFVEQPKDENGNRIYSYQVEGGESDNASVEAMMNLPSDLTVFALHSHGSDMAVNRLLDRVYSVYTTTPCTVANEFRYSFLLNSEQLVYYHPIKNESSSWADIISYTDQLYHYAFTASFVENYWAKLHRFEETKTFVYFNTCSAMSPQGRPIVDAVFRAGASLFAGWTYRSLNQIGPATASYIFDRLLGSNMHPDTMNDPHRPFSWDTLHDEMISLGYGKIYDDKYGEDKQGDARFSWLIMEPARNSPFKQLAPSIKNMEVNEKIGTDEQAELTIYGTFGSTQGEVFIKKEDFAASPLSIKEWAKDKIVCYLEPDDYGDVSVKVNSNRSNLRALSKWKGKIYFTAVMNPLVPQRSCTLQDKVTWDMELRADIAPYRDNKPEEQPSYHLVDFLPARKSTTTYESSGSQVFDTENGPVAMYTWSGSGQLGINDPRDNSISHLYFRLTSAKNVKMAIHFQGKAGSKIISMYSQKPMDFLIDTALPDLYKLYDEVSIPQYYINWTFNDTWSFPPVNKTVTYDKYFGVAGASNAPVTIKWDEMHAANPPRDDQYHGK